jgi:hypothetical protein
MRVVIALLTLLLASACAPLNNLPWGPYPTYDVPSAVVSVHVDQNGDFYPDDWHTNPVIGEKNIQRNLSIAGSFAANGDRPGILNSFRIESLENVARTTVGKQRVFVLVHGFNAEVGPADAGYAVLKQTIALASTDAVIQFYWDGLTDADSIINGGRIWFPAVATSQHAGSRALRAILRQLHDQEVIFITHSRGASVVLSAISNPNYTTKYAKEIDELDFAPDFLDPPETDFRAQNLKMNAIFLAPAIGNPDFWKKSCKDKKGCAEYRDFVGLKSIRHTVNPGDPVLGKRFFTWNPLTLPCSFNATTLGYTEKCGSWVRDHYNTRMAWLIPYQVQPMKTHSFVCYAGHPVLRHMLHDIGVESRRGLDPNAMPPRTCRNG